MTRANHSWLWRYGIATLSVGLAVLVRMLLAPVMGDRQPFPTLYVALTLAAWFGGRGPVLYALALGYLAASWFFVEPFLEECLKAAGKDFRPVYAGRAASASPATGLAKRHVAEQSALIAEALGTGRARDEAAEAAKDSVRHAGKANA